MVNGAVKLEAIFLVGSKTVAAALKGVHMDGRPVTAETTLVTELTPQHINQALVTVPPNYWSPKC